MGKIGLSLIVAASLWGASDQQIVEFVTANLKSNPSVKIDEVKVMGRAPISTLKGWDSVKIFMDLSVTRNGKTSDMKATDMLFTSGNYIALDMVDATTKTSLKQTLAPKPSGADYDAAHLAAGSSKAPNKILVFSDPQCPFCKDFMTDALEAAAKNPTKLAVYYYHFPLTIHPSSPLIIRAALAAEAAGVKDVPLKVYRANFESKSENPDEVLAEFNKLLGTNVKKGDLFNKAIDERLNGDIAKAHNLLVKGTPAVYINGEPDPKREHFEKILKEIK